MKKFITIIFLFAVLTMFTSCSNFSPNNDIGSDSVTAEKYKVYLDIESENNLLFSTYDITIFLNGKEIGTVANGKRFVSTVEVTKEQNELSFCKASDTSPKSTRKIKVTEDMSYECTLGHSSSSIDIKNETVTSGLIETDIEMVDVTGYILSEAESKLYSVGFTDIKSAADSGIWDKNNWVVSTQNFKPGTKVNKYSVIQLFCVRPSEYNAEQYSAQTEETPNEDIQDETTQQIKNYHVLFAIKLEGTSSSKSDEITISIDGEKVGSVENGKWFVSTPVLEEGKHELSFYKTDDTSSKTTCSINVNSDKSCEYTLALSSSSVEIKNQLITRGLKETELKMIDVTGLVLSDAKSRLNRIGFPDIETTTETDIINSDNWVVEKQSVTPGDIISRYTIINLYCKAKSPDLQPTETPPTETPPTETQPTETQPTETQPTETQPTETQPTETQPTETQPTETPPTETQDTSNSVSYSTNTKDTVKNGNSGVYAYRNNGKSYYIYYIIDFDEGYVYCFTDGNGSGSCERLKIESGDLNSVLIITYHDGNDVRSNGLHFKYRNQPDHLILQDNNGFEYDFYTTDLNEALNIKDQRKIYDY